MGHTGAADLGAVIDNDLCIACGACVAVDPSIELVLDPEKQMFRPSHPGNQAAAEVCPAVSVDFEGHHERLFPGRQQTPYGVVTSVMLAQSTDRERNLAASSGALIKEILREVLDRGDVDGAIVLRHVAGLDFAPTLITTSDEVDALPGSIYHNLAKDRVIPLLREARGTVAIAAIPCELEGLHAYVARHEPELLDKIGLTIGLLCGWQYTWHSVRALASYNGVRPEDILDIAYRGDGPVGKVRMATDAGEVSVSRRLNVGYQVAFDRTFNTTRCHLCVNHVNYLADVVVGDAWLPQTLGTRTGVSLVINRRPRTDQLLRDMAASGRIAVTEVGTDEIRDSLKPRVAFGDFAYAYADYRRSVGLATPDMTGPNRAETRPVPREEVEAFHREMLRKQRLQREGRYRLLYWRKLTRELGGLLGRYVTWFRHRVLGSGDGRSRGSGPRPPGSTFR